MNTIKLNAIADTISITADGYFNINTAPADLTTQQLASGSYESTEWINYYSQAQAKISELIAHLPHELQDELEDLICDANCDDDHLMRVVKDDNDTVWVFTVECGDLIDMSETELFPLN
mgnify:CR=1 FL=1